MKAILQSRYTYKYIYTYNLQRKFGSVGADSQSVWETRNPSNHKILYNVIELGVLYAALLPRTQCIHLPHTSGDQYYMYKLKNDEVCG